MKFVKLGCFFVLFFVVSVVCRSSDQFCEDALMYPRASQISPMMNEEMKTFFREVVKSELQAASDLKSSLFYPLFRELIYRDYKNGLVSLTDFGFSADEAKELSGHVVSSRDLFNQIDSLIQSKKIQIGGLRYLLIKGLHFETVETEEFGVLKLKIKAALQQHQKYVDRVLLANLGLVFSSASRKKLLGVSRSDRIQSGMMGLIHAIEKYNPELGYVFSTYATRVIHRFIQDDHNVSKRPVKLPSYIEEFFPSYKRSSFKLQTSLGREPTVVELAKDLGIPKDMVLNIQEVIPQTFKAREGNPKIDGTLKTDFTEDSFLDAITNLRLQKRVKDAILQLPEPSRSILTRRYFTSDIEQVTTEQLGKEMGVSGQRIRQIEAKGIALLKKRLNLKSSQ